MANADIIVVGLSETPLVASLYNELFAPPRDTSFFDRRFRNRVNVLNLIAEVDRQPVGFCSGFELKPDTWFSWLIGVLPGFRRQGVGAQLMDAEHAWAADHAYRYVRMECHNQHRAVLHLAISCGFDIVGLRYDHERNDNLIIFGKQVGEADA